MILLNSISRSASSYLVLQSRQVAYREFPCSSTILESSIPDSWCRLSTFCVITALAFCCSIRMAIASCPLFGFAVNIFRSPPNLRRQDSVRFSSDARYSENSIGLILFHMPVLGLRKSGMPDSVLIPAPVKKTMLLDSSINCLSSSVRSDSLFKGLSPSLLVN